MSRSNEPIWWSLFSAGGVVAAFLIPVTIFLTAIMVPAGWLPAEDLRRLVGHPLTRLYLFVLISLPMFHWAHRFRYVAVDLGLKKLSGILSIVCYGTAILVTLMALFFLVSFSSLTAGLAVSPA
jgi:fumarate reductase subunit D